jgi:hypothetical protein
MKEELTEVLPTAMERRRTRRGRSNLPVMSRREEAVVVSSTKVLGVDERRRRRGAGRRQCRFSIPRTSGEAQEARGQRKKTTVWGKKEKFTPAALFIYRQVGVVGVVVLHYPDRFCGKSPCGGTEWGGGSYNRATRQ